MSSCSSRLSDERPILVFETTELKEQQRRDRPSFPAVTISVTRITVKGLSSVERERKIRDGKADLDAHGQRLIRYLLSEGDLKDQDHKAKAKQPEHEPARTVDVPIINAYDPNITGVFIPASSRTAGSCPSSFSKQTNTSYSNQSRLVTQRRGNIGFASRGEIWMHEPDLSERTSENASIAQSSPLCPINSISESSAARRNEARNLRESQATFRVQILVVMSVGAGLWRHVHNWKK
ncbi:hypothetical protein NEOLEDRAFT_1147595 [Neolentinus lepideus HHB14362 ss-1]|uniref:Uncharacterized protein n=1 Tax=Neolentinus lepideus HHB14362 ss-1 TaxID=1314782 RepID=A0A165SY47_9AGAM|nr:hypothetical protein NEOLEDRAFT_1147595 [Neolentinus lepideus HHB14362 ss-1]